MTPPTLPNLFTHARSELAQDAVIAYILQWASPNYRMSNSEMNALGEHLLRSLLACSAQATGIAGLSEDEPITELAVDTQVRGIDILVVVNLHIALVIEDKIDTHEHSRQIARYRQTVSQILANSPTPPIVHAVYLKTGNESPHRRPAADVCGIMMREQLLAILHQHAQVNDQIVQQFRQYLQAIETETQSYRILPPTQWSARAIEGFYTAIVSWLMELHRSGQVPVPTHPQWSYQANQTGGERVCAWYWITLKPAQLEGWLQLSDATSLHLRIAHHANEGSKPKVEPEQMYQILQHAMNLATQPPWHGRLLVRKAGRFRGGDSAAVAELSFGTTGSGWLPLTSYGLLDWPEACQRLKLAMEFVEAVRSSC
jgi:hypothetical protein